MTIIRSEAEVTLSRERESEEYRRALDVIRSESAHLSNLIEGVLVLARADAQQSSIAMAPLQLANVIQDAVQALQRTAMARQISLTCITDGAMPMRGNAELIRRMLLNLLDNAIKFTGEAFDAARGERVHRSRGDRIHANVLRAQVRGEVANARFERCFRDAHQVVALDRFFRADAARERDVDRDSASGAGLGLSIARWIARAHGGDLRLVRSSAAGSIFEATLPI